MDAKQHKIWSEAMEWLFALGVPVAAIAAIVGVVSWAWRMLREVLP